MTLPAGTAVMAGAKRRYVMKLSSVGPSCIIEGDFDSGGHHNLEAVLFHDDQLHHLYGVPGPLVMEWRPGQTIPSPASGPGSLIRSDFGSTVHKNFEVVLW